MGAYEMTWFEGPVLGIESSCDETAAAITVNQMVKASIVSSQAELHRQWGGVVPEAASRAHVEAMLPVVQSALETAGIKIPAAVAVTNRPGLVGALSVGVTTAKALSLAWNVPLLGVHHLEGHMLSVLANKHTNSESEPGDQILFPHLCLIVSGGHTELVRVDAPGQYLVLSQTIDDAAGEAFDKGARLLGLGYPGGVRIQEAAIGGDPNRYKLPVAIPHDPYHFSFSGLKTAVLRLTEKEGPEICVPDAAASLQQAIVKALAIKVEHAIEASGLRALSLVGGVAANLSLRERLQSVCDKYGIAFHTPSFALCTDNAAMIAIAGSLRLARGERDDASLDCYPNAALP